MTGAKINQLMKVTTKTFMFADDSNEDVDDMDVPTEPLQNSSGDGLTSDSEVVLNIGRSTQ